MSLRRWVPAVYLWLCGGRGVWVLHQQLALLGPLGHHGTAAHAHHTSHAQAGWALLRQRRLQTLQEEEQEREVKPHDLRVPLTNIYIKKRRLCCC